MTLRGPFMACVVSVGIGVIGACSSGGDGVAPSLSDGGTSRDAAAAGDPTPVLERYAANLFRAYGDAVDDEATFGASVEAFLASPAPATLTTVRTAWLASRAHYLLTEGARFYGGPIDIDPPNHEGALNTWPLDEAYIDYTTDRATGTIHGATGFVNDPALMPTIDVAALDAKNGVGGDENVSNGYHAQEFLLWGQALKDVGPGERPFTDYTTAANADRRAQYLRATVGSVSQHLTAVRDAWSEGALYRSDFVRGGMASVALAFSGLGKFSKGELGGERMNAAYASKERRDQHDCFSSLTLTDYERDAIGIQQIYLGVYGGTDGPGLDELVKKVDPALDARIQSAVQASIDAMKAIPVPFEASITGDDAAPGRIAIRETIAKLRAQGDLFAEAATALGLTISVPEHN